MEVRQFLAEGGLILGSEHLVADTASGIKIIRNNPRLREKAEGTNIYVIVKRPKVRFHARSLQHDRYRLFGLLEVHEKNGFQLMPFEYCPSKGRTISEFQLRDGPEQKIAFVYRDESREWFPAIEVIQQCGLGINHYPDLQVLYVGQAFGKTGRRLAVDRLGNHRALKRIQNDMQNEPEQELFILMYRYGEHHKHLHVDSDQSVEVQASEQEEVEHLMKIGNISVERRLRIYLAEASLIRYFRPHYNQVYKRTFPSKKHGIVQKALDMGFSRLVVQIGSKPMRSKLWSPALTKPKVALLEPFVQFADYSFYSDHDKQTFLREPI